MEVAGTLVGSCVYWNVELTKLGRNYILEFQMSEQRLAFIELPQDICQAYRTSIRVMMAGDGSFCFVGVNHRSLHFWSMKGDPEGVPRWELIRRINFSSCIMSALPTPDMLLWPSIAAFSDNGDEIFLQSDNGTFTIHIRSLQIRKLLGATGLLIYPFASFYTRGRDIAGIDDRDDE